MFQWFFSRFKLNMNPYFRWETIDSSFSGEKHTDGSISIAASFRGQNIYLKLDKESADKLSKWMDTHYSQKGKPNNVLTLVPKPVESLSVQPSSGNTETSPPDSSR